MARKPKAETKAEAETPRITAGDWIGEFVNAGSLTFGQIDQPGPPVHVVEFSYIVVPIVARSPDRREWGGVVMIMAPPRGEQLSEAGSVVHGSSLPTLHLSLNTNRSQFSDLVHHFEAKRPSSLRFTIVANASGGWRLSGWHINTELS